MKKYIIIVIAVIGFGVRANAQLGARITNSISSICPPLNWENSLGLVFLGPVEEGNNAQIQTRMDIRANGRTVKNLKEYVDIEVEMLGNRVVSRTPFVTNSGIAGEKVVAKFTEGIYSMQNTIIDVFYYFFRENEVNNGIIITCSALDSKANKYLALFDESAKTFVLI